MSSPASPTLPINFQCINCGAHLAVDGSTKTPTCMYCKTEVLLPEEIWLRSHPAPAPAREMTSAGSSRTLMIVLVIAFTAVVPAAVAIVGLVVASIGATVPSRPPTLPPNPVAMAGEPCNGRRAACSKDSKADLRCGPDDKLAVAETCKGPNACRAVSGGKSITCDTTLGDPNNPCDIADDACSTDHKTELRCQAGRFAVIATCKGPDGCTLTPSTTGKGYTLSCDDHVADVGDPCFDTERTACSSDKKTLLTCTAQRFVVHRACKRGCTVKKLVGTANKAIDCE